MKFSVRNGAAKLQALPAANEPEYMILGFKNGIQSQGQDGEIHRGVGLVLQLLLNQTLQSAFYEIEASKRGFGIKAKAVRWPMRFQGPLLPRWEIETAASL